MREKKFFPLFCLFLFTFVFVTFSIVTYIITATTISIEFIIISKTRPFVLILKTQFEETTSILGR